MALGLIMWMSNQIATTMDNAQLSLSEAPMLDDFIQGACQGPPKLNDTMGVSIRGEVRIHSLQWSSK